MRGLTPCDVVMVVQPCVQADCGCSEEKTTNREAQCVSVQLLAVLTVGECEAEAVLPNRLPTPWTPRQELGEKVPAAMHVLPLMLNPYVVCALRSRSRCCSVWCSDLVWK